MRQALALAFAALSAGAVLALDPGQPPALPEPAVPEPVAAPRGWLSVADPGCVAGADHPARTEWPEQDRAVRSLTIWLNSRESIAGGPVDVDVQPPRITAWVPVHVEPVTEGIPVATCIRPVALALSVGPIPRADYEWNLQRGERPATTGPAEAEPAPQD
ncbi:hypothetical protein [Arenimonas terrae]|uniref:Uncharacterized protein n=1 Tax=Arenimonas terrae TaxID=2546226 RepID=A0A5C4RUV3_9GAMM|nr:hypothetical protein [Arenimonas terrae]TNJ34950.1 hypothetical protein E1B00_04005 [Arenimonas terrae]